MFYTQIPNFKVLRLKPAVLEPKTYFQDFLGFPPINNFEKSWLYESESDSGLFQINTRIKMKIKHRIENKKQCIYSRELVLYTQDVNTRKRGWPLVVSYLWFIKHADRHTNTHTDKHTKTSFLTWVTITISINAINID